MAHADFDVGGEVTFARALVDYQWAIEQMENDPDAKLCWTCSCGALTVVAVMDMDNDTDAIEVHGRGWIWFAQAIRCSGCKDRYRFAPQLRFMDDE